MPLKALQRFLAIFTAFALPQALLGAPVLYVGQSSAVANGESQVSISVERAEASAGINLHIVLPPGVTVGNVLPGALLANAGNFNLQSNQLDDSNLLILVYSSQELFSSDGELISLSVRLEESVQPGLLPISFATQNIDPLVNSRHAISDQSGGVSIDHGALPGSLLVYDGSSDFDGDGLTDSWELEFGLDPLSAAGDDGFDGDPDGDGYSNGAEQEGESDPTDGDSTPGSRDRAHKYLVPILDLLLGD